jgi:hypothetical protein
MPKYSKSHEREEREAMGRGLWHSLFGILFCWLPGVGLAFGVSGFARQVVRLTQRYRVRLAFYLLASVLSLAVCIAVLAAELYQYSRDPDLPRHVLLSAWQTVTGQDAFPWESGGLDVSGTDYTGMDQQGLGQLEGYEGDTEGMDSQIEDEFYGAQVEDPDAYIEPEGDSPDEAMDLPIDGDGSGSMG